MDQGTQHSGGMQAQSEGVEFTPVNPLLLIDGDVVGMDLGNRHSHVCILGFEGDEPLEEAKIRRTARTRRAG
jgi:hypothetical protein